MIFSFHDTATTEIYTLSLHDALPIWTGSSPRGAAPASRGSGRGVSSGSSPRATGVSGSSGLVTAPGAAAVAPASTSRVPSLNVILSPLPSLDSIVMTQKSAKAFPAQPSKFRGYFPQMDLTRVSDRAIGPIYSGSVTIGPW